MVNGVPIQGDIIKINLNPKQELIYKKIQQNVLYYKHEKFKINIQRQIW